MHKVFTRRIFLNLLFLSVIGFQANSQNGNTSDHWAAYLNFQKFQSGELNDSALHFLHKAKKLAFEKEKYNRYLWYVNEEARYLFIKSEPFQAIDAIKTGMERHKAHEDTLNSFTYAYSHGGIGFILYSMEKNEEAIHHFLAKAKHEEVIMNNNLPYYQKYPERLHNQLLTSYQTLSTCYQSIYEKTLKPDAFFKATQYAEKTWRLCVNENLKDQYGDALYTYGRLVNVLFPHEALEFLEISKQLLEPNQLNAYYSNLANFHLQKGNPEKAKSLLREGLNTAFIQNKITSRDRISTGGESLQGINNQLAAIHLSTSHPDSAINIYLSNIKATEDPIDLCESYAGLAKACLTGSMKFILIP